MFTIPYEGAVLHERRAGDKTDLGRDRWVDGGDDRAKGLLAAVEAALAA